MSICLQKSALIQPRTSLFLVKFGFQPASVTFLSILRALCSLLQSAALELVAAAAGAHQDARTLDDPFSAVLTPIFATKDSFCSAFRNLQDFHTFAPLKTRNFNENPSNFAEIFPEFHKILQNFAKFTKFQQNFAKC